MICGCDLPALEVVNVGRTTLNVDPHLVDQAMKLSGAKTKTDAINLALHAFIRSRERDLLRRELGSFDLSLTADEIRRLRQAG